jgi:hypothetical protein
MQVCQTEDAKGAVWIRVRLAVYRSVKALFNSSNGTNRHHKCIMLQNAIDIEPLHIMKQGNNKPLSVAWKEYVLLDQLCL